MGNGIAHVCALAGCDVALIDVSETQLDKALDTIGRNMDRQVKRGLITAEDDKDGAGAHRHRHRLRRPSAIATS